ncbi:MAG: CHAT domain-containing protein [Candidatus Melainabacteria bacterium]|nr:CHAT domain-containing protein [Candidatus Melainabacteria bacterium]
MKLQRLLSLSLALSLSIAEITLLSVQSKTTVIPKNQQNSSSQAQTDSRSDNSALFNAPADDKVSGSSSKNENIEDLEAQLAKVRSGKPEAQARALFNLAKAYGEARKFDQAEQYYREALAIDRKLGRPSDVFEDIVSIALVQSFAKKFDLAEATYLEALADAKSTNNQQWIIRLSNDLGALCIFNKQFDKAEQYYVQARDAAKNNSDFVGEAQARLNLGLVYQRAGQPEKGIAEAEAAQDLLGKDPENQMQAGQIALNLASLKEQTGNLDGALVDYKRAAQFFEGAGEGERQGSALVALGNQYLMRGQAKEAIAVLEGAVTVFRADENLGKLAQALLRLGSAQADCGNFTEAQRLHTEAANTAYKVKAVDDYLAALYEFAYDQYLAGNTDKALNKFVEVSAKLKGLKLQDRDLLADCNNSIALCYRAQGQAEAAVQFYQKAAENYRANGNKVGEASAENSIACVYLDVQIKGSDYLTQYKKVVSLLEATSPQEKTSRDYKRLIGFVDYNYAQYLVMQDKYDLALASYEKALADFTASGDRKGQVRTYIGLGLCKLVQGTKSNNKADLEQAIVYYQKAEPLASAVGLLEGEWDCAIGQGSALRLLGQSPKAESKLRQAIALFEKEKGQYSRDDSKTFTLDLRGSSFEELVALLFEQKRFDEALEIAERGRARAFLDLLEGRRQNVFAGQTTAAVAQLPAKIASQPNSQSKAAIESSTVSAAESSMRGVQVVPREFTAVDSAHGLSLETALSPVNAKAPDLKELKELVKASQSYVLEYFAAGDKLYIWLVNPQGEVEIATVSTISRKELVHKVTAAYQAIITPPKSITDLLASNQRRQQYLIDLYKILIEPVKAKLPKNADDVITVIPQAELFKVPFAALTDPSGRLFIEDHTLAVVPAIGVFRATQRLASDLSTSNDSLFAFGNPKINIVSGLGALPYAEREVKKISELFGVDKSFVKFGNEATKDTLRQFAPKSSVIHLATHGLIDEERPMDSAVLLATSGDDDGILSVKDILQLPPLKAKLVTLSACQTGRGKITGDGVAGLSRAFIIAGTPSVLVTLWNVDDVMTEYQMEAFYREYLKGEHKARALRDAQLKTIAFMEKGLVVSGAAAAVKIRANPRYWAAFQLIGNSQ